MKRKDLNIGGISFENPFFLAPMAGITDSPFRRICRTMGCALSYSEMVSAKAMYYRDKRTEKLLTTVKEELPVAYQLFGSEPEILAFAADQFRDRENCMIDINMGCPVPKVVKNGEGSALLKRLDLAGDIVRAVVKATDKPVTVKFRIGWDEKNIVAVEAAKLFQDAGAVAVAVHGRTREQYYSGTADWKVIGEVKAALKIPVIGNGDIWNAEDGVRMLRETGVDFVMVGRGALGNPWIFRDLKALWEGQTQEGQRPERQTLEGRPELSEIVRVMLWQLDMMVEQKGEYAAVREMRKHAGWYMKGVHGAAEIRRTVNKIDNVEELRSFLTFLPA